MKRILTIIFLVVFATSAVGINIWTSCCEMNDCHEICSSNCCASDDSGCGDRQVTYLKLQNDYVSPLKIQQSKPFYQFTDIFLSENYSDFLRTDFIAKINSHYLPPGKNSDRLVFIHCFLI